jgi:hypothetical protein
MCLGVHPPFLGTLPIRSGEGATGERPTLSPPLPISNYCRFPEAADDLLNCLQTEVKEHRYRLLETVKNSEFLAGAYIFVGTHIL